MTYNSFYQTVFFLSIFIGCNAQKKDGIPKTKDSLKLVWSDEFSEDGRPDSKNWTFENGFVRNNELQWYQSENAYCRDGFLIIEGRREKKENPNYAPNSNNWDTNRKFAEYTSSCLITKDLHSWKYGRFEIRARIDTSLGLWPAICTLGVNGEWPQNGEIDIMEFYRIDHQPYILANAAWGTNERWKANWNSSKNFLAKIMNGDKNWPTKFHIWRMDWTENSIQIYLDDVLLNTTYLNATINPDGTNPFKQPHYLLLNLAIGENGGDPSATKFPTKYEIDYVRVFQ